MKYQVLEDLTSNPRPIYSGWEPKKLNLKYRNDSVRVEIDLLPFVSWNWAASTHGETLREVFMSIGLVPDSLLKNLFLTRDGHAVSVACAEQTAKPVFFCFTFAEGPPGWYESNLLYVLSPPDW